MHRVIIDFLETNPSSMTTNQNSVPLHNEGGEMFPNLTTSVLPSSSCSSVYVAHEYVSALKSSNNNNSTHKTNKDGIRNAQYTNSQVPSWSASYGGDENVRVGGVTIGGGGGGGNKGSNTKQTNSNFGSKLIDHEMNGNNGWSEIIGINSYKSSNWKSNYTNTVNNTTTNVGGKLQPIDWVETGAIYFNVVSLIIL